MSYWTTEARGVTRGDRPTDLRGGVPMALVRGPHTISIVRCADGVTCMECVDDADGRAIVERQWGQMIATVVQP